MKTCATCKHWRNERKIHSIIAGNVLNPIDPDTYKPMEGMPFEVRLCAHPSLTFCERPVEIDGFGVCDGSEYAACLVTAQDFGCVRHEESVP